jgi:hypothetical protein
MKNILTENMRRFNTKNLYEQVPPLNRNVVYRTQYAHIGVKLYAKSGDATAFIVIPKGTEFKVDNSKKGAQPATGTCYMVESWTSGAPDFKKMDPFLALEPSKQGLFLPYFNFKPQKMGVEWSGYRYNTDELIIQNRTPEESYQIGANLKAALTNAFMKVK